MPALSFKTLLEAEAGRSGIALRPETLELLAGHYRLLEKWNRAVRLIGSTDPQEVIRRHVLESLAVAPFVLEPRGALLDIGSGNGYPAIPLKCLMPDLRLAMLEPTIRKKVFLEQVIAELGLRDCTVQRERVDRPHELARWGKWDTITMRGVAAIPAVLKGAAAALRPGGRLILLVGDAGRRTLLAQIEQPLEIVTIQTLDGRNASFLAVAGVAPQPIDRSVH